MDKNELSKLPPEQLAEAILLMGHIIRRLDESSEYLHYWTQDGEYVIYIPGKEVREHLRVCPICKRRLRQQ